MKLISNGKTGEEWITHLESKGYQISSYAKEVLRSPDFKPSKAGTEYKIAIIKGSEFNSYSERTTIKIRDKAKKLGYETPNAEIGCLLREAISNDEIKDMGLWYIVAMHEPIKDYDGGPDLLSSYRSVDGRWLRASFGRPDGAWNDDGGFAFLVPQGTLNSDTQSSSILLSSDLSITDLTILKSTVDVINRIIKSYEK